jgi:hypothetical protein
MFVGLLAGGMQCDEGCDEDAGWRIPAARGSGTR